jgi:peptidyl-tRNA hydrolase
MKLFVIVRKDLSTSQRAVQAGHAVAQFLLCSPSTRWKNGTLIYLGVKGLKQLENLKHKFTLNGITFTEFKEPDIGYETTAIATDMPSKFLERLNLL